MTQDIDPCKAIYDNPLTLAREEWISGKLKTSIAASMILHHPWYKEDLNSNTSLIYNWFKKWEPRQIQGCVWGLPNLDNTEPIEYTEETADKLLTDFGYAICMEYFGHYKIPIHSFICAHNVDAQLFHDVTKRDVDIPLHLDQALCNFFNEEPGTFIKMQKMEREWLLAMHQRTIDIAKGVEDGTIETIPWSEIEKDLESILETNPSRDS